MLQPVIQFGTAIHGKSLSGGALNRIQELLHVLNPLSVLRKRLVIYRSDSNKPGPSAPCGDGHNRPCWLIPGTACGFRLEMGKGIETTSTWSNFTDSCSQRHLSVSYPRSRSRRALALSWVSRPGSYIPASPVQHFFPGRV
jgi:hypothetical protein